MDSEITIDAAGRLVLPVDIRRKLGLVGGSTLRVRLDGERVVMEPVEEVAAVQRVGSLLVATGSLQGELVDHRALRDARSRRIAGLE